MIIIYDCVFFLGLLIFGHFDLKILIPALVAGILLLNLRYFIKLPAIIKIILLYGLALFSSLFNYTYIGELDKVIHFKRLDFFFAHFDMLVFNMPVADFLGQSFPFNTAIGWFFNDLVIVNYILFYFLSLYATFAFYFSFLCSFIISIIENTFFSNNHNKYIYNYAYNYFKNNYY